jgi:hypothetical protein
MCLFGRGLVVGSCVPLWYGVGGRQLCAFHVGVCGRQLCAILLGGLW